MISKKSNARLKVYPITIGPALFQKAAGEDRKESDRIDPNSGRIRHRAVKNWKL